MEFNKKFAGKRKTPEKFPGVLQLNRWLVE
jgi:hypothetical protein